MDTLPLSAHGMPSDGGSSTLRSWESFAVGGAHWRGAARPHMTMTLVETAAVGRVSVDDLAAVGIARSIGFATMVLGMGVGIGLEPLAAQAVGAGERGRAWQGFVTSVRASLLLWPVTMGIALAATLALPRFGIAAPVVQRAQPVPHWPGPGLCSVARLLRGQDVPSSARPYAAGAPREPRRERRKRSRDVHPRAR